ncbi:hypothetical protein PVAP13_2NG280306 [Panicum virgatum]|uniref:Uncharacterized protein n=1 Tax=Panicum virgatum TaxID=38727 RepID=A0A8T0VIY8_PANVG|nr:hypothetical protein PVAP13_2NG280306 [Panicum virgatum]
MGGQGSSRWASPEHAGWARRWRPRHLGSAGSASGGGRDTGGARARPGRGGPGTWGARARPAAAAATPGERGLLHPRRHRGRGCLRRANAHCNPMRTSRSWPCRRAPGASTHGATAQQVRRARSLSLPPRRATTYFTAATTS